MSKLFLETKREGEFWRGRQLDFKLRSRHMAAIVTLFEPVEEKISHEVLKEMEDIQGQDAMTLTLRKVMMHDWTTKILCYGWVDMINYAKFKVFGKPEDHCGLWTDPVHSIEEANTILAAYCLNREKCMNGSVKVSWEDTHYGMMEEILQFSLPVMIPHGLDSARLTTWLPVNKESNHEVNQLPEKGSGEGE